MKIAVLMSTYNGEAYIREQIASILAQEVDIPLSLIVRDDGSTDSTKEILQAYAEEGKLTWYSGENLKPAHSFLDLLNHCPGYDFYAFCDQDDVWHSDKLACALARLNGQDGPAMYFANARLVDGNLDYLGRNVYNRAPHRDFYSLVCSGGILGCTIVFNQPLAALLQNAPTPKCLTMHDAYLSIVCAMFDGKIFFDEQPHMDYRQHGKNVIGSGWSKRTAIRDRLKKITTKAPVSIAQQAQALLDCYPHIPDSSKVAFLKKVAAYPTSFFRALSLACSRQPKYNGKNMAVTMRLAILFRNK